jgi:hypothetical protein
MLNKHVVTAVKLDNKIHKIDFRVFSPSKCSIEIEDDKTFIIKIGSQSYVIAVEKPRKEKFIVVDDQSFDAYVLNSKNNKIILNDKEHQVVLDGNMEFSIDDTPLEVKEETLLHDGKEYRNGDEITINGRTAKVILT